MGSATLLPGTEDLRQLFALKYGDPRDTGWGPRWRLRFRHYTPDDWYEAVVDKLVTPSTRWLEVGCGRNLFPSNAGLAQRLAERCDLLVGVDPDPTLEENPFVHEKVRQRIDEYRCDREYELVTLRMVAEHVSDPEALIETVKRLVAPGAGS